MAYVPSYMGIVDTEIRNGIHLFADADPNNLCKWSKELISL